MADFTFEQALALCSQEVNEFVVDFEDAFIWLEYSRKDHAKRHFMSCGFTEGVDYQLLISGELRPQGGYSNLEVIRLTVDCFKMWGMMSGTAKGREIRRYFIEAEKQLRALQASAKKVELLSPWKPARELTKHGHNDFVNAYIRKRHPGAMVHDLITKLITGYSAAEARELPNVDGDSNIGLNHQPSPEQLEQIAEAKRIYCGLKKGTWKEQCYRAVWQACPENGDDV